MGGATLARGVRCGCGGCESDRVGAQVSVFPLTCLAGGQAVLSPLRGERRRDALSLIVGCLQREGCVSDPTLARGAPIGSWRRGSGWGGVGLRGVSGDAEEEVGGFAGAFAALHSGGEGVGRGGGDAVDGLVVEFGFVEQVEEFVGDGGEVVGDDEAGAGGAGGFEGVDTLFDVGAGEPEGEGFEGGGVLVGDAAEGEVLGGEVVDDGRGGLVGGVEE